MGDGACEGGKTPLCGGSAGISCPGGIFRFVRRVAKRGVGQFGRPCGCTVTGAAVALAAGMREGRMLCGKSEPETPRPSSPFSPFALSFPKFFPACFPRLLSLPASPPAFPPAFLPAFPACFPCLLLRLLSRLLSCLLSPPAFPACFSACFPACFSACFSACFPACFPGLLPRLLSRPAFPACFPRLLPLPSLSAPFIQSSSSAPFASFRPVRGRSRPAVTILFPVAGEARLVRAFAGHTAMFCR